MGDLAGLIGLSRDDWVTLILCLPWVLWLLGRIVPRKQVDDWRELYFASEATRKEAVDTIKQAVAVMDKTREVVESTLAPIRERARDVDS